MSIEAWYLHKQPSGDTSALLSLFTREKGIVSCLYKGGRTPKKQGILQAFMPLCLFLDNKKDWYYVRQLECAAAPLPLRGNALFAGMYVNELLYYALKPLDPHPQLYEKYHYTLKGLSLVKERLAIESLLRQFEWVLLDECGYQLSFFLDEGELPDSTSHYRFIAGQGFIAATEGIGGDDVLAIIQGQFDDVRVLKAAKWVMRQAIAHLLGGRELSSRHLFSSLSGNH